MNSPYFIEPFVDKGLGNSAYLIGSHDTKKGILIDPLRDVDQYLHAAQKRGLTLTHVLDTHLHADFISGNREIAHQTGALIGASAEAKVGFDHQPLAGQKGAAGFATGATDGARARRRHQRSVVTADKGVRNPRSVKVPDTFYSSFFGLERRHRDEPRRLALRAA